MRSSRASPSPPSRSARARPIIAVRADATAAIRGLEAAIGAAEEAGFIGFDVLGVGPRHHGHRPAGPGRVHARRGDRPAEGARGQARPARAAAAASRRARPVRHADRGPQRARPLAAVPWIMRQRHRGVHGHRLVRQPGHRSSSRSGPRRATASRRSRSARRCVTSSGLVGRLPAGRTLKAVLVGGPSGGLLPPERARHAVRLRGPCARSARTSARARSSSPTIAPASSTSPAS